MRRRCHLRCENSSLLTCTHPRSDHIAAAEQRVRREVRAVAAHCPCVCMCVCVMCVCAECDLFVHALPVLVVPPPAVLSTVRPQLLQPLPALLVLLPVLRARRGHLLGQRHLRVHRLLVRHGGGAGSERRRGGRGPAAAAATDGSAALSSGALSSSTGDPRRPSNEDRRQREGEDSSLGRGAERAGGWSAEMR